MAILDDMYQNLQRRPRKDQVLQEGDDDNDEMDDGETEEAEMTAANEEDRKGSGMEVEPSNCKGPIIDEDGFQVVQGRGKRKGR